MNVNTKIKVYLYPFILIFVSILPWYLFAVYILKVNFDSIVYQAMECKTQACLINFKIFFYGFLSLMYLFTVAFNLWRETLSNENDKEKKTVKFWVSFGKIFIVISIIQFVMIILFFCVEMFHR